MVAVSSCSAGSSLPHTGSHFINSCPCFCSSLHWLTSPWPHLAPPAHVSIHLHKKLLSLACQSCFISHQVKQAIICYRRVVPGRSGTIQRRGKLWQPAVESGTCKVILGMQVKRRCGIKIPRLCFRGLYPCGKTSQKCARNSTAFIPTKVKLRLNLNTLQLKQKLTSRVLYYSLEKENLKSIKIWQGHATYQRASPREVRGQPVRPPCSESCYCSAAPKVL